MEQLIGYVFDQPNGQYKNKYYFEYDEDAIFTFLVQFKGFKRIVTDTSDEFVCSAEPDEIASEGNSEELLDYLNEKIIELFFKGLDPLRFIEVEPGVMKEESLCKSIKY